MKMRILLNFSGLVVILGLMLMATGCNGTSVQYDIPEHLVDETIYLSAPSSFNLTVIGGQLIIPNAGHSGILIYRRYFDLEYYDFAAYELACPYHWNDGCGLLTSSMGDLYLTCGCNDHKYQALDGQSIDTSYTLPVKEFSCQFDGGNIIRITN